MNLKIKRILKSIDHLDRKIKILAEKIINLKWHHKSLLLIVFLLITSGLVISILLLVKQQPKPLVTSNNNVDISTIENAVAGKDYVDNELLLKITGDNGEQQSKDFADINKIELINFDSETGIAKFKAENKDKLLDVIRNNTNDRQIEPNWLYETQTIESNPDSSKQWGYKAMDTQYAYGTTKGSGIKVAIIDTGIDVGHPEFNGRISPLSYNSCSKTNDLADIQDKNGHGTHVAGIIGAADNNIGVIGVAPETEIVAIKAQCPSVSNGSFSDADLISAISYVAKQKINVLNMSLGSSVRSSLIESAIADARTNGVIIVAAAGNSKSSAPFYPASYNDVISVSALKYDSSDPALIGRIKPDLSYTNYGSRIDFSAPGTDIYSTYLDGGYKSLSGTSMASPQVAGLVALILAQNPSYNLDQVKNTIKDNAIDRGDPGKDQYYGWGAVNAGNIFSNNTKNITLDYRYNNIKITFKAVVGDQLNYPNDILRSGIVPEFWYKDSLLMNKWNFSNDVISDDMTLYLRWQGEVSDEFTHLSQDGTNYIFGFDSNAMTYQAVMAKIKRSWNEASVIFHDGGQIIAADAKISTGDIIRTTMANKSTKDETVILVGDISSTANRYDEERANGMINNDDLSMLNDMVSGILEFPPSNIDLKSADINNDGKIDKDDITVLQDTINNNATIDQKARTISTSSFKYQTAMIGDVYQDGKVSIADAITIEQYLAGIRDFNSFQKYVADTNHDDQITEIDAKIIQRYLAGKYASLPAVGINSIYGDVNWDGKVDQTDISRVQRYLNYHEENPDDYPWYSWSVADVNLDDAITALDLDYISQYVAGTINKLPVLR